MTKNGEFYGIGYDLAEESPLRLCGYSVRQEDGLSQHERQNIIAGCIESGDFTDAAVQTMKEQNIDFGIKSVVCDGIEACRMALLKLNKGILDGNFIEGMACIGGCIGGAGCLTHEEKSKAEVDKYGREALEKNISDAISLMK